MRIGTLINVDRPLADQVAQVASFAADGFSSAWAVQIFGRDSLTALACIGSCVDGIDLGTAVVPVHPRHPQVLAQQALTVQEAVGGRLTLGIGLSHRIVVEGMWGYSFNEPASYMEEYLDVLGPLLAGDPVDHRGPRLTAVSAGPLSISGVQAPRVVVAALGARMLRLAGTVADGTVTWMTGTRTVADHIVPSITVAAQRAGRLPPRVVVSLPVVVTGDPEAAAANLDREMAMYPHLPSYKAMLDREGVTNPSQIALLGSASQVAAGIERLVSAGATDLVAALPRDRAERQETIAVLCSQGEQR